MGAACCTEMQNGKIAERRSGSSPIQDPECKDSGFLSEPKQPVAVDTAAVEAQKKVEEALVQKQAQAAATKIQAKFRGAQTRESVSRLRENTIMQNGQDPELQDIDLTNLSLQSKPSRMAEQPQGFSPRTLAAFDSRPMRDR